MTPEAQRIAIAEAYGFSIKHCKHCGLDSWHMPDGFCLQGSDSTVLPDYLNDLNAANEAEKSLSRGPGYYQPGGWGTYYNTLVGLSGDVTPIDATAAQRAEALLRSLNLWKD